jgi:hypothetical protein
MNGVAHARVGLEARRFVHGKADEAAFDPAD